MRQTHLWQKLLVCHSSIGRMTAASLLNAFALAAAAVAAPPERPTFNNTADPRPNILPDWIYNHNVPYRLQYNRPTYHGGKIAYHISPTSQEALAWEENLAEGRYNGHNCPPVYKRYMYPKPWEALNTLPRPTYAKTNAAPVNRPAPSVDLKASEPAQEVVPAAPSPSDR